MGCVHPMVTHESARSIDFRGRGIRELHQLASRLDKHSLIARTMPKKPIHRITPDNQQLYLMRIADLLSDDPILTLVLGSRFKVVANCDLEAKRITYSFRCVGDTLPDEWGAKQSNSTSD